MRFRITFTTLPPIKVEIELDMVEAFAMHYCTERGLDPSTGKGPHPLSIQRIPELPKCPQCGSEELQISHNTLNAYCQNCDEWFEDKETEQS